MKEIQKNRTAAAASKVPVGGLSPLISAGELVDSDDSDEEEEIEPKEEEDKNIGGAANVVPGHSVVKPRKPTLGRFESEFLQLKSEYQVVDMDREVTYELNEILIEEDNGDATPLQLDSPK